MNLPDKQPLSSALTHPDRRLHPRYKVRIQIELQPDGSDVPLRMETTDLSRGGCYVHLMMAIPLATYVHATLWLDNCPVGIRGRVVTRHPQFGNGIMFLDFEGNGEQILTQYLEGIAL